MKKIILLMAIVLVVGCKKKDDPEPQKQTKKLTFSGTATGSGVGGNQLEFSINGGAKKIISFSSDVSFDTVATTGDTYYLKVSSLDFSQKVYGSVGFGSSLLKTDNCSRNISTPDNCSITLSGSIP